MLKTLTRFRNSIKLINQNLLSFFADIKMSQQLTQKPSSIWSFCLGILVVLVLINQLGFCSARYLPTRADESRKEMIKTMLKEVSDLKIKLYILC